MTPLIQSAAWMLQPILEVAVAVLMLRRKQHRTFPVFFTYLAVQILTFCILFPIQRLGSYSAYFYSYWITSAVSLVFGFKVIYEIFQDVFRPYHALKDLGTVLFKWAGLVMLLAAAVIAVASPSPQQGSMVEAVMITQRGVRVIHCGLVLFLLVFARHLGVSWKQQSFGIALGFGFYSAVELTTFALYSSGRESVGLVTTLTGLAYCCTIAIWFGFASFKVRAREESANLATSHRWNESLADIHNPAADGALIPMFEGMVDRAFSRTPGQSFMMAPDTRLVVPSVRFGSDPVFAGHGFRAGLPLKY